MSTEGQNIKKKHFKLSFRKPSSWEGILLHKFPVFIVSLVVAPAISMISADTLANGGVEGYGVAMRLLVSFVSKVSPFLLYGIAAVFMALMIKDFLHIEKRLIMTIKTRRSRYNERFAFHNKTPQHTP